jgi:syntaxin 1B/2/3
MQDLLQKKFAQGMAYVDLKKNNLKDVEAGQDQEMDTVDTEKNLAQFFDEVGQIKSEMERIKELLVKLQDMNDESKTVHKAQTMKQLRDRMDKDVAMVSFSPPVPPNTLSAGRWFQRAKS